MWVYKESIGLEQGKEKLVLGLNFIYLVLRLMFISGPPLMVFPT